MNTPLLLMYARPMNYRAAGDPTFPVLSVRVASSAPAAQFFGSEPGATNIATAEKVELVRRADGTFATEMRGSLDHGLLWAVAPDGRVLDRIAITGQSAEYQFGADGKFHEPGMPGWVAPVAIVGGVALVAAIVVAARR